MTQNFNDLLDPYLVLMPKFGSDSLPPHVLAEVGRIRRASNWIAKGFSARPEYTNMKMLPKNSPYRFIKPIVLESIHINGINSGFRISDEFGLADFEEVIRAGVELHEFIGLSDHRRSFAIGIAHAGSGDLASASSFFQAAYECLPADRTYRNRHFETRQALGDIDSIPLEVEANADEIPGCVHSGRAKNWLKVLYGAGKKETARSVVRRVDELLRAACEAPLPKHTWGGERDWRISKHAEFARNARTYGIKLAPYAAGDGGGLG